MTTPMPEPLDFSCPHCAAPVGEQCQMRNGRTAPHGARTAVQIQAAIKWATRSTTEGKK